VRVLRESDFRFQTYEQAVQNTAFTLRFLEQEFKRERGRPPHSLREDFAGSAAVSYAFANVDRFAFAVDHDEHALAYGEQNHGPHSNVRTYCADVMLELGTHDLCVVENFSIGYFHERSALMRYLEKTYRSSSSEGAFFCDLLSGSQLREGKWQREHQEPFSWSFQQISFEPLSGRGKFTLELPNRSGVRVPAFQYDWRLYGVAELREAFLEAGFSKVSILSPAPNKGNVYRRRKTLEPTPMEVLYLVAWV